jgi:hypothetical protein
MVNDEKNIFYNGFHGFGQTKFANSGLILGSSQFLLLPQRAFKNKTRYKSSQN